MKGWIKMDCECLPRCPFFNDKMMDMPAMVSLLKEKYCKGDSARCARHMVFKVMGSERVPMDLYPNQAERAEKIIQGTS